VFAQNCVTVSARPGNLQRANVNVVYVCEKHLDLLERQHGGKSMVKLVCRRLTEDAKERECPETLQVMARPFWLVPGGGARWTSGMRPNGHLGRLCIVSKYVEGG
jgi:hypothetical protein